MMSLEQAVNDLIDVCKQEFNSAFKNYQSNPGMGWVVREEEMLQTFNKTREIQSDFPEYKEKINAWLQKLEPFRRDKILDNYSECMQIIESLQNIVNE